MGEHRGLWAERPRPGRDDAQLLLAEHVHALRQLPYSELRDREDEVVHVTGVSGDRFERRTRATRGRRGGHEELRVLVQVANERHGRRGDPLAEELVVATPDGEMVGEYALAAEGNDPRRYVWPAPWVPWAMVATLVVLVALAALVA